jgi:hypothetical protein
MFVRNSTTIYLECDFSKGHVQFWFFGLDWFQNAAIVEGSSHQRPGDMFLIDKRIVRGVHLGVAQRPLSKGVPSAPGD